MLDNNPSYRNRGQDRRYSARISPFAQSDMMLVTQTTRSHLTTGDNRFTIDDDDDRNTITCHVGLEDDQAMGPAIRNALRGES